MIEKLKKTLTNYWVFIILVINLDQLFFHLSINLILLPFLKQKNILQDFTKCLNQF